MSDENIVEEGVGDDDIIRSRNHLVMRGPVP
jgi:hypothetical protein